MILTLSLWFTLGVFIGVLVFFVWGFFTLPFSTDWQLKAADYYTKIAQRLIGRSGLLERGTKWDLISIEKDAEKNADTFELGDDTAHVTNETGLLSHWFKQPFGLLPPPDGNRAVYVSPELGELGETEVQRREQDTMYDDADQYQTDVALPARRPGIRLREYVQAMIPGTRSYFDLAETIEIYKQSQSGYVSSKTVKYMIWLMAYGLGAGVTWLVMTQAGGVGDAINIPVLLGGWV